MVAGDNDKTATFRKSDLPATLGRKAGSLIVVKGSDIGYEVHIDKSVLVIGRSDEADIYLNDHKVSRRHAILFMEESAYDGNHTYLLRDNNSTNGTFINNQRIGEGHLKEGDKISIGDSILKFSLLDEVDTHYQKTIYDLINYDELTGLLTIRFFYQEFIKELERSERLKRRLSVLMMDLDYFKSINDAYGHQAGSHVLRVIGRKIREALRIHDVAGRYGGEEFVAYLPNSNQEQALACAERLRRAVEKGRFRFGKAEMRVTISIGVATFPDDGTTKEILVKKADEALYRAKESGRNRVCT
ncbi:diguanylate cyclase [Acidobacteriota bacterium]